MSEFLFFEPRMRPIPAAGGRVPLGAPMEEQFGAVIEPELARLEREAAGR